MALARCRGWVRALILRNSKCFLDSAPFDKCLRLLAVCVIKQNGILWKPFLWCHRHLSKGFGCIWGRDRVWQLWHFTKSHCRLGYRSKPTASLKPLGKFPVSYIYSAISWQRTLSTCYLSYARPDRLFILQCSRVCFEQLQQVKQKSFLCLVTLPVWK